MMESILLRAELSVFRKERESLILRLRVCKGWMFFELLTK
jgi:hypothetical protein